MQNPGFLSSFELKIHAFSMFFPSFWAQVIVPSALRCPSVPATHDHRPKKGGDDPRGVTRLGQAIYQVGLRCQQLTSQSNVYVYNMYVRYVCICLYDLKYVYVYLCRSVFRYIYIYMDVYAYIYI